MKKYSFIIILLLCILVIGCDVREGQAEQTTETVRTETKAEAETTVIRPLPDTSMEALNDSVVNISFAQDDFYRDETGKVFLRMQVYSYDKFDMVDISGIKAGDTILVSGEEMLVNAVDRNDYGTVLVNGGLDEGGFDFATDDGGVYYIQGYSDMKSWSQIGEAECPVSPEFVFTDGTDLELGEVIYSAEDILNSIPAPEFGYQPQNTTVRIENGVVVAMDRIYTP